jgi:hypothetical protein
MPTRTTLSDSIRSISERLAQQLHAEISALGLESRHSATPDSLPRAAHGIRAASGQADALRALLAGCSALGMRAALFVIKQSVIECWEGVGFQGGFPSGSPRGAKLSADAPAVSAILADPRSLELGGPGHHPVTDFGQAARARAALITLRVQDKTAALLYVDGAENDGALDRAGAEVLTEICGLSIERQVLSRAISGREETALTGGTPTSPQSASAPAGPPPTGHATISSPGPTAQAVPVNIGGAAISTPIAISTTAPRSLDSNTSPAAPPSTSAVTSGPPEVEDARRFARLLVDEIYLYHSDKVEKGREHKDILVRLGDEVARARSFYDQRIPANVRQQGDYFQEALVRVLAAGDAGALGEPARQP